MAIPRPLAVHNPETDALALLSSSGYLLVIGLQDLPVLSKGKGNKLMSLKKDGLGIADETLLQAVIVNQGQSLSITAGKKTKTFKWEELAEYRGERAKRGLQLPKGLQQATTMVAGLETEYK